MREREDTATSADVVATLAAGIDTTPAVFIGQLVVIKRVYLNKVAQNSVWKKQVVLGINLLNIWASIHKISCSLYSLHEMYDWRLQLQL